MSDKRDNLSILRKGIKDEIRPIEVAGITGSALAYLLSQLFIEGDHPFLIVLPNSEESEKFYKDLDFFLSNQNNGPSPDLTRIFLFPSYDISIMGLPQTLREYSFFLPMTSHLSQD